MNLRFPVAKLFIILPSRIGLRRKSVFSAAAKPGGAGRGVAAAEIHPRPGLQLPADLPVAGAAVGGDGLSATP